MAKLDTLVTDHLIERLFHPERLTKLLASLAGRRAEKEEALSSRIATLQRGVSDSEDKLKRLYKLIEDGFTDLDDVLKDRLIHSKPSATGPKPPLTIPNPMPPTRSALIQH